MSLYELAVDPFDLLYEAWGVIANAGWDDSPKSEGWDDAAKGWRDKYHKLLDVLGVDTE